MKNKMKFLGLPTWLLTKLYSKWSKDHPWKDRNFTLEEWYQHETTIYKQFDFLGWFMIIVYPSIFIYVCC